MRIFNAAIIVLFVLSLKATAGEISGVPSITDGDTIKILNNELDFMELTLLKKNKFVLKISKNIVVGKKQLML